MKIKPVDYDEFDTDYNNYAVCPYCGYKNEVGSERYMCQDEEDEMECYDCEKIFIYTIDYAVTFSSEPFENWIIGEIKYAEDRLERLHKDMEEAPETKNENASLDKGWYRDVIKYEQNEVKKLKKRAIEVLGG